MHAQYSYNRFAGWNSLNRCVRVFPALLAWIAIAVAPFLSPACCCQMATACESSPAVSPCCQSASDGQKTETAGCCSEAITCELCSDVNSDCPCEVRDQNLDQLVTTRANLSSLFDFDEKSEWVAVLPWLASERRLSQLTGDANRDSAKLMTSGQRCALLCRWLN